MQLVSSFYLVAAVTGVWLAANHAAAEVRVVATTTVVADLVRQVGGERVAVESLMADGVDPHSYRATPRDADRLLRADLIVANGLHLEGKLAQLLERLSRRRQVVAVAEAVPEAKLLPIGNGLFDPHVWFDAVLWSHCPAAVAEALAKLDAAGAAGYRQRAADYANRLQQLDAEARAQLAGIPPARRVLITAHDAFRYFGRAYGLRSLACRAPAQKVKQGWPT